MDWVTNQGSLVPGQTLTISASCPVGQQVYSGGVTTANTRKESMGTVATVESDGFTDHHTWTAVVRDSSTTVDITVTVQALCGPAYTGKS